MIELNLLPKELRRKKKKVSALPEIPVIPVCIGVVAILIVTHLTLLLLIKNNRDLSKKLQDNWSQIQPQKEKTDAFFNELNNLQKRVEAVRKIAEPDISWARILNGLNQAIVPNIWLSEFKLTFEKGQKRGEKGKLISLDLMGYAVGKSETALPNIGRFMESLKNIKDFSGYFREIELEDIRNYVISGEEVMMFKLVCHFKEIETVPVEKKATDQKKKRKARR
ncbi:MAG: hypothetical protein WBD24_00830 [Candidatus Omnitrophota bacterium]